MITATYRNTPVQIIELADATRRTFRVMALTGQPFKAYSNNDGDTAMSAYVTAPVMLLKNILVGNSTH